MPGGSGLLEKVTEKRERLLGIDCVALAGLMILRCFFGTEFTDEAYYVSDALAMLHGNLPYAYNNWSYGLGASFLLIPQLFIYEWIVPNHEGMFLFTRISFVVFRLLIIACSYKIMRKSLSRIYALFLAGFMIPFFGGDIQNYSYNTIPLWLCFLTAFLLYDIMEYGGRHVCIKSAAAGFLTAIAVFAHPGYGLALLVFLLCIIRLADKEQRWKVMGFYVLGGAAEILAVFIPVIAQAGWDSLAEGLNLMFHPYVAEGAAPVSQGGAASSEKIERIKTMLRYMLPPLAVFSGGYGAAYAFYKRQKGKDLKFLSLATAMMICLLGISLWKFSRYELFYLGGLAAISAGFILLLDVPKNRFFYLAALYPGLFSAAEIVVVGGNTMNRFLYSVPAFVAVFWQCFRSGSLPARRIAMACIAVSMLIMGGVDYAYMYRDGPLLTLKSQVKEGVYKGIFTTAERAEALPRLESYVNEVVGEDDAYAFRDNAPCGYLMMHHGTMCDISTWDNLQYSYHRNNPAALYAYYRRRNQIPQKIIYIDFGRDPNLSIEDLGFRYNEFVNSYYKQIDEVRFNTTFRVIAFEYAGGFPGNYEEWIEGCIR